MGNRQSRLRTEPGAKGDTGRQRRGRVRAEGKMCLTGHGPQCPAKNSGEESLQGIYLYCYLTNRKMGSAWWATSFNTKLAQMPCTSLQTPVLQQHHELRRLWAHHLPDKSLMECSPKMNPCYICVIMGQWVWSEASKLERDQWDNRKEALRRG